MDRRKFLGVTATAAAAIAAQPIVSATEMAGRKESKKKSEGIHVRFLGTGAADWAGKDERGELRRLSSILVENSFLIDFTDTAMDMLPSDVHPDTIFYTHSHNDHYRPDAALKIGIKHVYLGQTWYDIAVDEFRAASRRLGVDMPEITPLFVGSHVKVGDITVTALPANHATGHIYEQTLIYLLEKDDARILYATDTGGLPAIATRLAGIDAHDRNGKPITGLIMEATMGIDYEVDYRIFTHSSVGLVHRTYQVLAGTKRYAPPAGQPVYLTHMARTLHGTQAELDAKLPAPLKAAYDGLEVDFLPVK